MSRFDLTFRGEILPGVDPALARLRFGRFFGIDDPARIEQFFGGTQITLRRGLNRRRAAEYYLKLRHLGLESTLVKAAVSAAPPSAAAPVAADTVTTADVERAPTLPAVTPPLVRGPRQPGAAPNPYTLRPHQNSPTVARRADRAKGLRRVGLASAGVALTLLAALQWYVTVAGTGAAVPRVLAAASSPRGELTLATESLLLRHDRSGVESAVLELAPLALPGRITALTYLREEELLVLAATTSGEHQLFHCNLAQRTCTGLSDSSGPLLADAITIHRQRNQLILASHTRQQLSLHDYSGNLLATRPLALPRHPVLRLHNGLLLVNANEGPAVNVLRHEQAAFGEQLDQILLLPPAGSGASPGHNHDFVWVGQSWWALLEDPDTGQRELLRFDPLWNFIAEVAVPEEFRPERLVPWGEKLLVLDPEQAALLRFSDRGLAEAPLRSTTVEAQVEDAAKAGATLRRRYRLGIGALLLAVVGSLLFAGLHQQRQRFFAGTTGRNAPALDPHRAPLHWLSLPAPGRPCLRRLRLRAGLVPGHIGIRGSELVLVDHRGVYQVGSAAAIAHHRYFLALDDVLVYTGGRRWPEFEPAEWQQLLPPALAAARPLRWQTLLVLLVEYRHPLLLVAAAGLLPALAATAFVLS